MPDTDCLEKRLASLFVLLLAASWNRREYEICSAGEMVDKNNLDNICRRLQACSGD